MTRWTHEDVRGLYKRAEAAEARAEAAEVEAEKLRARIRTLEFKLYHGPKDEPPPSLVRCVFCGGDGFVGPEPLVGTRRGDPLVGSFEIRFGGMVHRHRNDVVRALDRIFPGGSPTRTEDGCLWTWERP